MKIAVIVLSILLAVSVAFGVFCVHYIAREKETQIDRIVFTDANSRETFFTIHNVRKAQTLSTGKGIKVGILDTCFGMADHADLYAGGKDFLQDERSFNRESAHGFWMALVLRETAPEAEIYALNTCADNEDEKTRAMVAAIDWAILHELDVLTYSSSRLSPANEKLLDAAIDKAFMNNVATAFIHCPNPHNILPDGLFAVGDAAYNGREADLHVCHYDYNVLMLRHYVQYQKKKEAAPSGDEIPFFSISSTSPITAGLVALLKGANSRLTPSACKQILIETSKQVMFGGEKCVRVPDAYEAVKLALHPRYQ